MIGDLFLWATPTLIILLFINHHLVHKRATEFFKTTYVYVPVPPIPKEIKQQIGKSASMDVSFVGPFRLGTYNKGSGVQDVLDRFDQVTLRVYTPEVRGNSELRQIICHAKALAIVKAVNSQIQEKKS